MKTEPDDTRSVEDFLAGVPDERKVADSRKLMDIMRSASGCQPVMWGPSIIGFGTYHYKYASGREGDMMIVGFSPRKQALVLYGVIFYDENRELAKSLGKHKAGKGCIYIKTLDDIDVSVLERMIRAAVGAK